jgi:hypothetical protein
MNNNLTPLQEIALRILTAKITGKNANPDVQGIYYDPLLESSIKDAHKFLDATQAAAPEVKPLEWMIDKNQDLLSTNGEFHIVTKNRETGHSNVCLYSDTGFVTLIASNFRSENDAMRYANFIRTR